MSPADAQTDQRRVVISRDADYFGADFDVRKDVTLDECQQACIADNKCQAFTYNVSAGWCFLKSAVGEFRTVAGAVSGRIVATSDPQTDSMASLRAQLTFISTDQLDKADQYGAALARRSPASTTVPAAMNNGFAALDRKDPVQAASHFKDALALDNSRQDAWIGLLRALAETKTRNFSERRALGDERIAVAANLYQRSRSDDDKALALGLLGTALAGRQIYKPAIGSYRASLALREAPRMRAAYDKLVSEHGFRLVEHRVDADTLSPQICLVFSDDLATGTADAADFVRVENGETLAISGSGRQVCIDGVAHGGRYDVTVRAGLPAADGETIEKSVALDIFVRDRPPSVRFPGAAYVLPGGDDGAIPVATVNAVSIDAKLYRVGDRSLARAIGDRQFLRQLNAYQGERIGKEIGELVWEGAVDVEQLLNREVVSAIPVRAITSSIEPGAYVLMATPANQVNDWRAQATQWFIVTDLGLSTLSGSDSFRVLVRSLTTANPLPGVDVRIVATNNEILGTARTNDGGIARFDSRLVKGEGGLAPALVVAELAGEIEDYSFLDLTRSELDLSDRGVDGREPPGPVDVYLTVDRGIYRPGETVHATALVRDAKAMALDDLPLTLITHRPDGKEAERRLVADQSLGGSVNGIAIAGDAMRGAWKVGIYADPKSSPLAEASYLVEDFLPERLDFDLTIEGETATLGQPLNARVAARYLYGAPAGRLQVSGNTRLVPVRTSGDFPGFVFGLADEESQPTLTTLPGAETDAEGVASLQASLPASPSDTWPLQAVFTAQITDTSGRPVERALTVPVRMPGVRLGLKPAFQGAASQNSTVTFEAVALDGDGVGRDLAGVEWTLSKVETDYQWYRQDGSWSYRIIHRKERVADGSLDLQAGASATIDVDVEWGGYELSLASGRDAIPVSHRFEAGWYVEAKSLDTPETLKVSLDRSEVSVGGTLTARIIPPFAGQAEVLVVDDRVIDHRIVDVPEGGTAVEFAVTEEWGAGAYVLVNLVRPMDIDAGRMPGRAMGLAWAGVDPGDRRIAVSIDAPQVARPRGSVPVRVSLDNLASGEQAFIMLAAVDAGILNLTGHETPDPDGWYFGQRKLGVSILDFYNQLIDRTQGIAAHVRSGGDASMMRFDGPPPPDILMAFHSGVIEVDQAGRALVDIPVPDFNGTVRLMVMAWSKEGIGHAVTETVFRDPVVLATSLPHFLAPGDQSRLLVDIDNVEALTGNADVSVRSDGGALSIPDADANRTITLVEGGRQRLLVPVTATGSGRADVTVDLALPDGTILSKRHTIDVRINEPDTVVTSEFELKAGSTLTLDETLATGFSAETLTATLSASAAGRLDVAGIVRSLDRYPYGCSEQITSRALPLVYLDDVILAAGLSGEKSARDRVQDAIRQLVARQNNAGGFGLWGAGSGGLWLDAYVTDFLSRAREKGYSVPDIAFRLAIDNLKNRLAYAPDFERGGEDIAYGLYLLARHGKAAIGDLRYYAISRLDRFSTPLAKAQIAAALMLYGDKLAAERVFRVAIAELNAPEAGGYRADYGSLLRDHAAVLTLASETGSSLGNDRPTIDRLNATWSSAPRMSTQDQAWSLLAAHALMSDNASPQLLLNGEPQVGGLFLPLSSDELAAGTTLENRGERPVYVTLSRRGVSAVPPPAGGPLGTIERAFYDAETGEPVDLSAVAQGQRIVVVLTVLFADDSGGRMIVDDPLPAGFEIENPHILRSGELSVFDWLGLETEAAHTEFRSGKFIAAFDRGNGGPARSRFAYVVRAVSPGSFLYPAALIEDMYRPDRRSRSARGNVTIIGPLR